MTADDRSFRPFWHGCGSRRAVGLASEGRGEAAAMRRRVPRVTPAHYGGSPWSLIPLGCSRSSSLFTAGAVGPGAPEVRPEAVEKVVTVRAPMVVIKVFGRP